MKLWMHIENIVCNPKYIYYRKHEGTVMQTNDRQITDLMKSIDNGTTQLPDFQRGWVWDDNRIRALIASITNSFPVGAAMFLEYGNANIRFKYRVIESSPAKDIAPSELILDGQQRLTSIYSSLYNPNPVHTRREIKEELDTEIEVIQLLDTVEYDYPKFHLSMDCFICNVKSGDLILKEHEAAKWLTKETLYSVDWLPADQALIGKIEKYLEEHA